MQLLAFLKVPNDRLLSHADFFQDYLQQPGTLPSLPIPQRWPSHLFECPKYHETSRSRLRTNLRHDSSLHFTQRTDNWGLEHERCVCSDGVSGAGSGQRRKWGSNVVEKEGD